MLKVKVCVRYIFASLFGISRREHLWNKEKCFLFHFESSFRSWDNQILTFHIVKCYDVIKCLSMKHETLLLNYLRSKLSLVMKFSQFVWYYKSKFFIKKSYEKCGLETSSRPFFKFKESSVKRNLRRSTCWFEKILKVLLKYV